jgi:hypothetical protein
MEKKEKKPSNKKPKIILVDDPLTTNNVPFLEELLSKVNGNKYLNAVQFGSLGGNYGIPSNSDEEPLNEYLAGGRVIRARYDVEKIRERYQQLRAAQ